MELILTMDKNSYNLMKEVCIKYYIQHKTQKEIGDELFISRSKVSRLLAQAREDNHVSIKLNFDVKGYDKISQVLMSTYKLEKVSCTTEEYCLDDDEFYKIAAEVIDLYIKEGMIVGCSWGNFISKIIPFLPERNLSSVDIVQLFGEITNDEKSSNQSSVIKGFAKKYNARFHQLTAPLHLPSEKLRDSLVKMKIIADTLKLLDDSNLIITSVGTVKPFEKLSIWEQYQDEDMFKEALKKGAVGYFCSYLINSEGHIIDTEYNNCNIAINKTVLETKKIMLVCNEEKKYDLIKGLLEAKKIDILVTSNEIVNKLYNDVSNAE